MSSPINYNDPYIKKDGTITTMENAGGGGGSELPSHTVADAGKVLTVNNDNTLGWGGGSGTPDYENREFIVGTVDDFQYYIPMSVRYIGDGKHGYEIKTNPTSSQYTAKLDVYSFIFAEGQITDLTLLKTLEHNGDSTYEDSNLKIEYDTVRTSWKATLITDMYETSDNDPVTSPVTWNYDTEVDYNWYML